jgi:ankyrin repeat protein
LNVQQISWLLHHGADVNELDDEGNSPLMLAVTDTYLSEQVRELIRCGADIHGRDRSGKSVMMIALDHGCLDLVGLLLEHGALADKRPDVDTTGEGGRLALLLAIYQNDGEAVHRLLDKEVDPNARNMQGRTPLMMAVEMGHADITSSLLSRGADVGAKEADANNWTALHVAAYGGQAVCARVLVEHGAEIDVRDRGQWTPLIWAAWSSSAAIVRLLLEHGANVHAEDVEGNSALSQAGWLGDEQTIRTLLEWGAASHPRHLRNAFHATVIDNNWRMAPLFVEAGLVIGLSEAVLLDDMDRLQSLLSDGADPDAINQALITAAGSASPEVVLLLLQHGADPNALSENQTALMRAYWNVAHGCTNRDVLLHAGADINARDEQGATPFTTLMTRCMPQSHRLSLMRKMIRYGPDINVQDQDGKTVLMEAARFGETAVARFLLQHGANVNVHDNEGRTALMFAASEGHTRMVRLLVDKGANTTVCATDGSTALTLAKRWVGKRIATILRDAELGTANAGKADVASRPLS